MFKVANRLTSTQVLYGSALLITLFFSFLPMVLSSNYGSAHGFLFANKQLQNLSIVFVFFLPTILLLLLLLGPSSKFRTLFLAVLMPINLLLIGFLLISYCLFCGNVSYLLIPCDEGKLVKPKVIGDLVINLNFTPYVYSNKFKTEVTCSSLRLERFVFWGFVKEYKTLITVNPALSGSFEVFDNGRKIKFVSPAAYGGREIIRIFDTDWNSKKNRQSEVVDR